MKREADEGFGRKADEDKSSSGLNEWPRKPYNSQAAGGADDSLLKDYFQPVIVKMLWPFKEDVERI